MNRAELERYIESERYTWDLIEYFWNCGDPWDVLCEFAAAVKRLNRGDRLRKRIEDHLRQFVAAVAERERREGRDSELLDAIEQYYGKDLQARYAEEVLQ